MRNLIRFIFGFTALVALPAIAQTPAPGLRGVVDPAAGLPQAQAPADPKAKAAPVPKPAPNPDVLLLQRVSQLMMVTFGGVNGPSETDRQLLATLTPGAIVLPRIRDPESAVDYVSSLRPFSAAAFEELPFLIGVDLFAQERYADQARVATVLRVPTMLSMAAAGPSETSAAVFGMMAEHVHAMGFNFHLGPALNLPPRAGLGAGSLYSFGSDPGVAEALARQFAAAMAARGLGWMPMGYPGGAGRPPMLLTPRSQLRARDLLPYSGSVAAGAPMLNVGTSLVPTLDEAIPACLSPIVIRDLRGDVLGYQGLIVAGPLDADEVRASRRPERAAVEALLAGADLLYWNTSGPHVISAISAIAEGVKKGAIDEAHLERALGRIRAYKKSLVPPPVEKKSLGASRKLSTKQEKFPEPAALERRAITLARNEGRVLPLSEASQPIAVVALYGAEELKTELEEFVKPIAFRGLPAARQAGRIQDFELSRIVKISQSYRCIVYIYSDTVELRGQQELIQTFKRQGKRVVVVVLGYPPDLASLREADAIVLAYGSPRRVGDTMKAVAEVLMGQAPVEILPPLRALELRVGEKTVFNVNDVLRSPVGRLPIAFDSPYTEGFSISYRPTASLNYVRWEFGDGTKSSSAAAEHAFEKPGEYIVSLSVGGSKTETTSGNFRVLVK